MSRFLQLHFLTFYPPSNLNRDDLGRPKSAIIGGVNRLRISSQALKRTWRTSDTFAEALDGHLAKRTQRLGETIHQHLLAKGIDTGRALKIARDIATAFGKPKAETDKNPAYTEQLAFISAEEQQAALALADRMSNGEAFDPKKQAADILRRTDTAADIAMFGRMLADNPDFNREASVQVAHAVTTHKITIEDDYYTAVDDLKLPSEDAGAGFLGEAGFGAGVFYLYVCIDNDLLARNLAGDTALAGTARAALAQAAATVAPGGKQASYASRSYAQYILAEAGNAQPRTLAGAFLKPVTEREDEGDMLAASVNRLTQTRDSMDRAYGPCAETHRIMDVVQNIGTLAEIMAFCRDCA
ncbi:type I-E CRISPR-associated protein Cas7/Cse4/CasC [Acidiphilium acidophilum]|uniref:type I-E CRISPR-associated protein Cas7/Cse4/CasC n=1 Tax=Acidiphilium acidophilum TaxID=76588 RepID=UPI002E8E6A27|nr:type I-E CRISPR-associated protein Cas7/Cse4/CasC [Acidiphilium acidophilum]